MEWISIKDRLPDKEDLFLVYTNGYGPDVANFDFYKSKRFQKNDYAGFPYNIRVDYWMPIEEPKTED